jgi:TolB-like protein
VRIHAREVLNRNGNRRLSDGIGLASAVNDDEPRVICAMALVGIGIEVWAWSDRYDRMVASDDCTCSSTLIWRTGGG